MRRSQILLAALMIGLFSFGIIFGLLQVQITGLAVFDAATDFSTAAILNEVNISTASGDNGTWENITATVDPPANATIKNMFDWRIDDVSIATMYLEFENDSTVNTFARDYSSNLNPASVTGPTFDTTTGYDGFGSYTFDGIDDYMSISDDLDISDTAHSIVLWFKFFNSTTQQGLYHNGRRNGGIFDSHLDIASNNFLFWSTEHELNNNTNLFSSAPLSDGQWHHIAAVYDGAGNKSFYINGEFDTTQIVPSFNNTNPDNEILGAFMMFNLTLTHFLNGSIDEFRFYNRALSAEQISALYNSQSDVLVAQETSANDTLTVCVRSNDRTTIEGGTTCSNNLTIASETLTGSAGLLNSTDGSGASGNATSDENLTIVADSSGGLGPSKQITSWYESDSPQQSFIMTFDGGTLAGGQVRDYAEGSRNGTLYGTYAYDADGGFDGRGAYNFTPISSGIAVPELIIGDTEKWSLSFWLQKNIAGNAGGAIAHNVSNNRIYVTGSDIGYRNHAGTTVTHPFTAGTSWNFYTLTFDGFNVFYYANGEYLGYDYVTTGTGFRLAMLGDISGTSFDLNGMLDEVHIWNRQLTASQIKALYDGESNVIASSETLPGELWSAVTYLNDNTQDTEGSVSNNVSIITGDNYGFTSAVLNTSSTLNTSTEDVLATFSYSDTVEKTLAFYRNSSPINVLIVPVVSASEPIRDYSGNNYLLQHRGGFYVPENGSDGNGALEFPAGLGYGVNISPSISFSSSDEYSVTWRTRKRLDNLAGGVVGSQSGSLNRLVVETSQVRFDGAAASTTFSYDPDLSWHAYALIVTPNIAKLYVDGSFIEMTSMSNTSFDIDSIGDVTGTSYDLNGWLDDLTIWDVALTSDQVALIHANTSEAIAASLVSSGDVWYASAVPSDKQADGAIVFTENVSIGAGDSFGFSSGSIDSTSGLGLVTDTLTADFNFSQAVDTVTRWEVDGSSIQELILTFDSEQNPYYDYSEYGRHGSPLGSTGSSVNSGFDGDGALEIFDFNAGFDLPQINFSSNDEWTVTMYVEKALDDARGGVFGIKDVNTDQLTISSSSVTFHNSAGTLSTFTYDPDINMHHYAFVANGTQLTLYVDGVSNGTNTVNTSFAFNSIGNAWSGTSFNFVGLVDEVTVWNRALSGEQVSALYANQTDTIVANETQVSQTWQAFATPTAENSDGVEVSSALLIIASTAPIPEFSDYALMLMLVLIGGGFVVMRKKQ